VYEGRKGLSWNINVAYRFLRRNSLELTPPPPQQRVGDQDPLRRSWRSAVAEQCGAGTGCFDLLQEIYHSHVGLLNHFHRCYREGNVSQE